MTTRQGWTIQYIPYVPIPYFNLFSFHSCCKYMYIYIKRQQLPSSIHSPFLNHYFPLSLSATCSWFQPPFSPFFIHDNLYIYVYVYTLKCLSFYPQNTWPPDNVLIETYRSIQSKREVKRPTIYICTGVERLAQFIQCLIDPTRDFRKTLVELGALLYVSQSLEKKINKYVHYNKESDYFPRSKKKRKRNCWNEKKIENLHDNIYCLINEYKKHKWYNLIYNHVLYKI